MILWRISAYADLSGTGGLRVSGRWHQAGRPVVYAATTPAGARLEVLVRQGIDPQDLPPTMRLLRIELPDTVSQAQLPPLQPGWSTQTELTRGLGNRFLDDCSALLLPVPSAIMPRTTNYLFNPRHPQAHSARLEVEDFTPDSRLF